MNIQNCKSQVLVVDDEKSIRVTLKDFLEDENFEVETAGEFGEARQLLSTGDFDVAVVDRILSDGSSGIELIMHIKEISPYCQTILITAYPTVESERLTMKTGSWGYLVKPVSREDICSAVKGASQKSIQLRQDKLNFILSKNEITK